MSSHLKPVVNNSDHIQGKISSTIELVEFGDFQCPHCAAAHPVIKKIQREFGDELDFVFRNFPLTQSHQYAMMAAIAAEAAALQGKFWQMHDIIFENQRLLGNEGLFAMASSAGLDINKFKDDIQKETLQQKVESDFESGIKSGVNGTPSFFVNGTKFDGGAEDLFKMLMENSRR